MPAHILLIEDNENLRELVQFALEDRDYLVTAVVTGEEALQLSLPQPLWDFIVTDVRLPGRYDGPQTVQQLRQKAAAQSGQKVKLPFLVMTGFASLSVPLISARLLAYDYIYKPFSQDQLLEAVARGLRRGEGISRGEKVLAWLSGLRKSKIAVDPAARQSRQECWQQFYVLIRSRALKLTGLYFWDEMEKLEASWADGVVTADGYRRLQHEILSVSDDKKMRTPAPQREGRVDLKVYQAFHDRVEQGLIDDHTFFLACSARLASAEELGKSPELAAIHGRCWT